MLNQSFTAKQFKYLVQQGDYQKYFNAQTKQERHILRNSQLAEVESSIDIDNYSFSSLLTKQIKNKQVFLLKGSNDLEVLRDDFVIRKINHNIRRIYKVKQADRYKIVSQVKTLLKEPLPFFVCKIDIKDFYESIDRTHLLKQIDASVLVSYETKELLHKLFNSDPIYTMAKGLPRGINISATLSELYMKKFDLYMSNQPSFYFYARFVDDIIFFSTEPITKSIIDELEKRLPDFLSFNRREEKHSIHDLGYPDTPKIERIDYLGYRFNCDFTSSNGKISKNVTTQINAKKLNKIKSKIVHAFLDYRKKQNFKLLKQRLLFLTATYPLKTQRKKTFSGSLHGGIYYNYALIDDMQCLKELDDFLWYFIRSQNRNQRIISVIQPSQINSISRISFVQGYKRKIFRNLSLGSLKEITGCWKDV